MNPSWIVHWNDFAQGWAASLWRASWQGGVALLLVWAICRTSRGLPARWKVWLWRLAFFKCVVAFFCATALDLPLLPAAHDGGPAFRVTPMEATMPAEAWPIPVAPAREQIAPNAQAWLLAIWLIGFLICGTRLFYQHRIARELRRESRPIKNDLLHEKCRELARLFQLTNVPLLLESPRIERPGLIGIIRPAILLPGASLLNLGLEQLRLVFAHEMAHHKRRDLLWMSFLSLCDLLFFFHPLLWLAKREYLMAQEIACDELALQITSVPAANYGSMLLDVVAVSQLRTRTVGLLSIVETKRTLQQRLLAMKQIKPASTKKTALFAITILLFGSVAIVPWRVVAQVKPEDELIRLKEENAKLKEELRQTKAQIEDAQLSQKLSAQISQLRSNAHSLRDELNLLLVKYTDVHPLVVEKQAQIQAMQRQISQLDQKASEVGLSYDTLSKPGRFVSKQSFVRALPAKLGPLKSAERELLLAEVKLAEQEHALTKRKLESGNATYDEMLRVQRDLFALKRDLAPLGLGSSSLRDVIQEEMKLVEAELQEIKKRVEIENLPIGSDIALQRELLRLQRELLGVK